MSLDTIASSIFITNTFAAAYPEEHLRLWKQFEQEVPFSQRSGTYGADNVAYIRWLKKQKNPVVLKFLSEDIIKKSV